MIKLTLPIRIESERNLREHHMAVYRRAKFQKETTALVLRGEFNRTPKRLRPSSPYRVTLTRIGPKKLDGDNLAGGFKAVQDAIARELRVDDGDEASITWKYQQHADGVRDYAVIVQIEGTLNDVGQDRRPMPSASLLDR